MSHLFRQLGRGARTFFGRQLPQQVAHFGRQLSHVAGDVSHGLGKAHRVLSNIEKFTNNVPVLGQVVGALDSGVVTAQHGSNALGALGRGNIQGAYNEGKATYNSGKGAIGDIGKAGIALAPYLV